MRLAWERVVVVLFSGVAWMMILMGGAHVAHALRNPPRLLAHAGSSGRRQG